LGSGTGASKLCEDLVGLLVGQKHPRHVGGQVGGYVPSQVDCERLVRFGLFGIRWILYIIEGIHVDR